ncbi:hypothetical protein DFP94_107133 [Fontibacillus phaseoli]|uniref:Uncharacterized protein n=1 Tax=Fontibacillus phaseoli TaxID=1416533 RepID=A0A369BC51_9BACL|nr:hypothetical protein [Fontibacillus phaseoli]RCX18178.1 hypothetical protein DFP94_107133 [Fontibacillus phaseoli]
MTLLKLQFTELAGILGIDSQSGNGGRIQYDQKIHFYRAWACFAEHAKAEKSFEITELPRFEFNGTMLDASRNVIFDPNGVPTAPLNVNASYQSLLRRGH